MVRRLLLITTLGIGCIASAEGDVSERANSFGVLSGSTLTCSATPSVAGCYLERRFLTLGPAELTVGVDAQVAYGGGRTGHLAPYVGLAWYAPTWSTWLELYMPHTGIPTIGRPEWFRVGFTLEVP